MQQTTGHWGLVVDELFLHFVFDLDGDGKPVSIDFTMESVGRDWFKDGKVMMKEDVGSTSLPLPAIIAIADSLIIQFGDYRRLYRNSQTFADILVEIVCDVERKDLPLQSLQNVTGTSLLAFPMTEIDRPRKPRKSGKKITEETKSSVTWEDVVDAEINEESNKLELEVVVPKPCCVLL